MTFYMLKTYGPSGRIVGRTEFQAFRDDEARAAASAFQGGHRRELWCGSRLVADWSGVSPSAAPRDMVESSCQ